MAKIFKRPRDILAFMVVMEDTVMELDMELDMEPFTAAILPATEVRNPLKFTRDYL